MSASEPTAPQPPAAAASELGAVDALRQELRAQEDRTLRLRSERDALAEELRREKRRRREAERTPPPQTPPAPPPPPSVPPPRGMVVRLSPRALQALTLHRIADGGDDHARLRRLAFLFTGREADPTSEHRVPEFVVAHVSEAGAFSPVEQQQASGRGGFGVVRMLDGVAVKFNQLAGRYPETERFDREAALELERQGPANPFVVPLRVLGLGVGVAGGDVWDVFAMTRMAGTLEDFASDPRRRPDINAADLLAVLRELLRAVQSLLRDFGLLWVDAKSANVLYRRVGPSDVRLYICDPGSLVAASRPDAFRCPCTFVNPFPHRNLESDAAWAVVVVCLNLVGASLSCGTANFHRLDQKHLRGRYGEIFGTFRASEALRRAHPQGLLSTGYAFLSEVFFDCQGAAPVNFCSSRLTFDRIRRGLERAEAL